MAIQSSGAISLTDVQTEFGGSAPTSISEYYGAAAGVPGSGTISLSDFYGKSAALPTLSCIGGWTLSGASWDVVAGVVGQENFDSDHYVINHLADKTITRFGLNSIGPNSPPWAASTGSFILRHNSPKFLHLNTTADLSAYPFANVRAKQQNDPALDPVLLAEWDLSNVVWQPYGGGSYYMQSGTIYDFGGAAGSTDFAAMVTAVANWLTAIDLNNVTLECNLYTS